MDDFFVLLGKVGQEGLHWWRENAISKTRISLQKEVRIELEKYIVAEAELPELLKRRKQQDIVLIPLHTNHMGSIIFLRPLWDLDRAGIFLPSLQLWVAKAGAKEIVGFRFEFPDRGTGTHTYPHMQLTQEFDVGAGLPSCGCSTVTVTYPAVPLPVRDALDLLLTVYVAIRGYKDNSVERLRQMLRTTKDQPLQKAIAQRLPNIAIEVGAI